MPPKRIYIACVIAILVTAGQATAGVLTFTTAAALGRLGPTQGGVDIAYAGTALEGHVTVSGFGIQNWTVATTGLYRILAAGAQGASGTTTYVGGMGALVGGDFFLNANQQLQIAVGQMGSFQGSTNNGGGGGGSFVVDQFNNPLLVAAGGGGTRTDAGQNGHAGQASQYGTTSSGNAPSGGGMLKVDDLGFGGDASFYSWGSGGAGFLGNGADDSPFGTGGLSWADGLLGGTSTIGPPAAPGGFGGGGAGNGSYGGGGGGGYSGGDGGWVAGGGGSFLGSFLNPVALSGFNDGDGYVTIELVESAVVSSVAPEPTTLAIFGIGTLCLAGFHRRKKVQTA